jgi:hypothetical protein
MKSTNPISPFNWQEKPSSLFTKKELGYMKQHALLKSLEPKGMNFYQKAKPAKDL